MMLLLFLLGFIKLGSSFRSTSLTPARTTTRLFAKEQALFGMGCFWAPQQLLEKVEGVTSTRCGYTGGTTENPTYSTVCGGDGHVETVLVEFDSAIVSYDKLLDVYWSQTAADFEKQRGQYASALWTTNPAMREAADARLEQLRSSDDPRARFVRVAAAETFYPAEGYHQSYWDKQLPRNLALAASVVASFFATNLPPILASLSSAVLVGYIALYFGERLFDKRQGPVFFQQSKSQDGSSSSNS
jgi:peptide-methionine (S)-S-oxide reductase